MTDFYDFLEETEDPGQSINPYAGRTSDGVWIEGAISIDFLNKHFGHLETAEEMINATDVEALKLYFVWLRDNGILN